MQGQRLRHGSAHRQPATVGGGTPVAHPTRGVALRPGAADRAPTAPHPPS